MEEGRGEGKREGTKILELEMGKKGKSNGRNGCDWIRYPLPPPFPQLSLHPEEEVRGQLISVLFVWLAVVETWTTK